MKGDKKGINKNVTKSYSKAQKDDKKGLQKMQKKGKKAIKNRGQRNRQKMLTQKKWQRR